MNRRFIKRFIPKNVWQILRKREILLNHRRCAEICEHLISESRTGSNHDMSTAKKELGTEKIIWQYWAQGYDHIPAVVQKCLESVDRFAGDCTVIRLSDETVSDYLDIPEFVKEKRDRFSTTHYSDLLRTMLLSAYGGLWLDATVLLTDSIPDYLAENDFFMFQRDPQEPNKKYWENSYAYYFGWSDGFRVNVLSSIIYARKGSKVISTMRGLLLDWWKKHDTLPDYFFFQILFDVLVKGELKHFNCPVISDCGPHKLMQAINDSKAPFKIDGILLENHLHKLSYKDMDLERLSSFTDLTYSK